MSYKDMPRWNTFVQDQLDKARAKVSETPPHEEIIPQEVGTDGKETKSVQAETI